MTKNNMNNKKKSKKIVSTLKKDSSKIDDIINGFDGNIKHTIIVVIIIVVVLGLFYLLTLHITSKNSKDTSNTDVSTDGVITYDDIMVGRSFNVSDGEYLVLYYDKSDSEVNSTYSGLVSSYKAKDEHLDIYTVDMSNGLNKKYSKEESNYNPTQASEIAINGPTLIKYSNGTVIDYIEGQDGITNYLK